MPIEESRCMFSVVATTTTKVPLLDVLWENCFSFYVSFVLLWFLDSSVSELNLSSSTWQAGRESSEVGRLEEKLKVGHRCLEGKSGPQHGWIMVTGHFIEKKSPNQYYKTPSLLSLLVFNLTAEHQLWQHFFQEAENRWLLLLFYKDFFSFWSLLGFNMELLSLWE